MLHHAAKSKICTDEMLLHPLKASSPMALMLLGMVIEVSAEQLEKALEPIDVTLLGISIDVSSEQYAKALEPIDVTLLGMMIDVKFLYPLNA